MWEAPRSVREAVVSVLAICATGAKNAAARNALLREYDSMILSHSRKFIFLHCRKTAGSSMTVALAKLLADDDVQVGCVMDGIAAGVRPPKSVVRGAVLQPALPPAVYLAYRFSFWEYVNAWSKYRYRKQFGNKATHATAAQVKAAFPREWDEYLTFAAIRNPWDKTVSDYFWRTKGRPGAPSFAEFVAALENGDRLNGIVPEPHSNWGIYTINDELAVDRVVRFESLEEDMRSVLKELNVPWDGWVPKSKQKFKAVQHRPKDYREMYTDREIETVGRLYAKEVKFGGYSF